MVDKTGMDAERGPGRTLAGLLAGVAVVVALALALVIWIGPPRGGEQAALPVPDAGLAPPPQVPAPAPAVAAPAETTPTGRPSFDLVRVGPDGMALVAGRGTPGAEITLRVDGVAAAPVQADGKGQFATFLGLGDAAGTKVISLSMRGPDGHEIDGPDDVIVAQPTQPSAAVRSPVAEAADTPDPPPAAAPPSPAAPDVLALGPEGPRVVAPVKGLSIDTLAYEGGGIRLGGRAEGQGTVRVYVDGTLAGDAELAADGTWRLPIPVLAPGRHSVRADRLDDEGAVAARAELPFAADPGAMASSAEGPVTIATVQPGESLWRIAERRYGDGHLYVRLFAANRTQILDPDLIYPGQVFTLPE